MEDYIKDTIELCKADCEKILAAQRDFDSVIKKAQADLDKLIEAQRAATFAPPGV